MTNVKKAKRTLIKALNDRVTLPAGIGTIISVPSYIHFYIHNFSKIQLIATSAIGLIAFIVFIWRTLHIWFQQNIFDEYQDSNSLIDGGREFKKNWLHTSHHSIIDCIDRNGKEVRCRLELEIQCLKPCEEFYQLISPADKIANIEVIGGEIEYKSHTGNQIPLLIKLEKPAVVGQVLNLTIAYTLLDSFTSKKEFWKITKYYKGSKYKITVLLPHNRPAKGIIASIRPVNGVIDGINIMECVKYYPLDGRSIIEVEEKDRLQLNQEFILEWHW